MFEKFKTLLKKKENATQEIKPGDANKKNNSKLKNFINKL